MELEHYRQQLDEVDRQLAQLFCQRMELAGKVAAYKRVHGLPILDPGREQAIRERLCAQAPLALQEDLNALYSTLFALSRAYQERCLHTGETK